MPNILHLGKFYPPDTGGIESVTATLARGAVRAGHQVTVLCFGDSAVSDAIDQHVQVCRVPQTVKLTSQPLGWRYLLRGLAFARRADLVHVHAPNMLAALLVLLTPSRTRVVVHWHSDVVGKGWLGRILAPLERGMLKRADVVVCTSQLYAEASETVRPFSGKVVVVPIGVPDQRALSQSGLGSDDPSCPLPPSLQAHARGRPVILCVGRLVPYKGYTSLIEAAALMTSDAAILIVGGGPLREELQTQIEALGQQERVMLAGRVDDLTLATLLRTATVFCMPSVERSEAFGVALVEAMTWGLPLVSTRIPGSGVPWVNIDGESGINVEPANPEMLAMALDRLLNDFDLRQSLASGARRRYEALFTEEKTVLATLAVYDQVLQGRR